MNIKFSELMITASGAYLSDELPKTYPTMLWEEIDDFIKENYWAPLEYEDVNSIFEAIENLATGFGKSIEAHGGKVDWNS